MHLCEANPQHVKPLMILFLSPLRQVYDLMRRCWEKAPERRITFKRLIEELTAVQQQLQQQNSQSLV